MADFSQGHAPSPNNQSDASSAPNYHWEGCCPVLSLRISRSYLQQFPRCIGQQNDRLWRREGLLHIWLRSMIGAVWWCWAPNSHWHSCRLCFLRRQPGMAWSRRGCGRIACLEFVRGHWSHSKFLLPHGCPGERGRLKQVLPNRWLLHRWQFYWSRRRQRRELP